MRLHTFFEEYIFKVRTAAHFPFTTNVTISTSMSQTFLSRVAIFHPRHPMMACLPYRSYGMQGLAPLMHVLF